MKKKYLFLFLLFLSPIILANHVSYLETEHFLIKIMEKCSEGNVDCDDVSYTGTRKKDNATVYLTGKTMSNPRTLTFQGYEFHNGKVVYYIYQDGTLVVMDRDHILLSEKGNWKK